MAIDYLAGTVVGPVDLANHSILVYTHLLLLWIIVAISRYLNNRCLPHVT